MNLKMVKKPLILSDSSQPWYICGISLGHVQWISMAFCCSQSTKSLIDVPRALGNLVHGSQRSTAEGEGWDMSSWKPESAAKSMTCHLRITACELNYLGFTFQPALELMHLLDSYAMFYICKSYLCLTGCSQVFDCSAGIESANH